MLVDPGAEDLLGEWVTHPFGPQSGRRSRRVCLDFRPDGRLIRRAQWRSRESKLTEIHTFRFRLEGGLIVLCQSSPSREERVGYLPNAAGILHLRLGDYPTTFIRKGFLSAALWLLAGILAFE